MKSKTKIDKILTEYEKAQDSAEHHNNSMWNLIYIGLGLSLAIIYIFWTTDTRIDSVKIDTIKYIMLIFGSIILAYFSKIIEYSNENKKMKYRLCKKIEKENNFIGQHLDTKNHKNINLNFLRIIIFIIFLTYLISIGFSFIILNNLQKLTSLLIVEGSIALFSVILSIAYVFVIQDS